MEFPKELYNATHYRVVFSDEEMKKALLEGWQEAKPEHHPYVPVSAAGPATAKAMASASLAPPVAKPVVPPVAPPAAHPVAPPAPVVATEKEEAPEKRGPGRPPNPK